MTNEDFIHQCLSELGPIISKNIYMAYNQGFEDALKYDNFQNNDDIQWVDLELPSGNLWAVINEKSPYIDADFLPSKEDFEELSYGLRLDVGISTSNNLWPTLEVKGLNGINFRIANFSWWRNNEKERQLFNDSEAVYVWIKAELEKDFTRQCLKISIPKIPLRGNVRPINKPTITLDYKYTGDSAILLYCKKK